MRLLFACRYLYASGSHLRLERVGKTLKRLGHECAYVAFSADSPNEFESQFPILTFEGAKAATWDATLVPGAGFSYDAMDNFARLKAPQFGVRIQLILNDQHIRPRFLHLNSIFEPDLVIFNSEHWPPGSYSDFQAKHFHTLIGAVDTQAFVPEPRIATETQHVIGAQASKNPWPLLEALAELPPDCVVRFFGVDRKRVIPRAQDRFGARVEYVGPLFDTHLADYYRGLSVMVSTEERAGWANVVAEAMASGIPVVTTPAGTLGIAKHRATALVMEEAEPSRIASAILELKNDPILAARLAHAARQHIEAYDWHSYTSKLLELIAAVAGRGRSLSCS